MSCIQIALIVLLASFGVATAAHPLDSCPIKVEPIGCYRDERNNRALPDYILNGRDSSNPSYDQNYLIMWGDFKNWLPKFICGCATKAFAKGYRVIGLQFFAECWGSMNGHQTYGKHGKVESCVNETYGLCNTSKGDVGCMGEASTNFVYRIAPTACDTYYEPVGCFNDKQNVPRPLPDYILTERDYTLSIWNKYLIDWKNWNTYSPEMICRCAAKAKALKRTTFSMQFYGECWSGEESKIAYSRDGGSKECLAQNFDPCPYNSYHCVGKAFANRVYRLKQAPVLGRFF